MVAGGQRTSHGDGGPATAAQLLFVHDVATDASGDLFIADSGDSRIRKVDTAGIDHDVAGSGAAVRTAGSRRRRRRTCHQRGPLQSGWHYGGRGGNLFIADKDNLRIRKVDTAGTITTVAGTGTTAFGGDGAATAAELNATTANVAIDGQHRLFISDAPDNQVIRRSTPPARSPASPANTSAPASSATAGPRPT